MIPLRTDEIRRAIRGRWLCSCPDLRIVSVSIDTRTAIPGDLFIALRGERFDGHDFLTDAARAGCVAAVVSMDMDHARQIGGLFAGGLIGVDDTTEALGRMAMRHREMAAAKVIAVTGSNGKTTVKRMIHHILSRRMNGSASPGSFNNQVGLPITLLSVGVSDDYVVCEVGSSAPGEVMSLGRIARPDVAVITSIGETHLAGLGNLGGVAAEKASLLASTGRRSTAVVWADSEVLTRALEAYDVPMIRFGVSPHADLRLTEWRRRARGQQFQINGHLCVDLTLPGRHNALNAMAAIAVARRMGMVETQAADALSDFPCVQMRTEWVDCGPVTVINDTYNANPSSLLAAVDVLGDADAARRVLVVGDMRELGEREKQLHTQTGRDIAVRKIDLLIGVGRLGRYIVSGAADAGLDCQTFSSTRQACKFVPSLLRKGDVVLVKGSRAMNMERVVEAIRSALAKSGAAKRNHRQKGGRR